MKTLFSVSHWCKALFITGLLSLSASAFAADMVLILDGIQGESRVPDHRSDMDVLAFSEGVSVAISEGGGGGGSTVGRASKQDISITKWLDSASPSLRSHLTSGRFIRNGSILVYSNTEVPYVKFEIELTNILVSSVAMGGSSGEDRLTENVTLNYETITWTYTRDAEGGPGAPFSASWDFTRNTPISNF